MRMADTVQIAAGLKADMPTLIARFLGYCTDAKELYIGTSGGVNVLLASNNAALGKFANITITGQTSLASTSNGELFEDTTGELKYKSTGGTVINLTQAANVCASQSALESSATLADVISAFNALLAAMKSAGQMEDA